MKSIKSYIKIIDFDSEEVKYVPIKKFLIKFAFIILLFFSLALVVICHMYGLFDNQDSKTIPDETELTTLAYNIWENGVNYTNANISLSSDTITTKDITSSGLKNYYDKINNLSVTLPDTNYSLNLIDKEFFVSSKNNSQPLKVSFENGNAVIMSKDQNEIENENKLKLEFSIMFSVLITVLFTVILICMYLPPEIHFSFVTKKEALQKQKDF